MVILILAISECTASSIECQLAPFYRAGQTAKHSHTNSHYTRLKHTHRKEITFRRLSGVLNNVLQFNESESFWNWNRLVCAMRAQNSIWRFWNVKMNNFTKFMIGKWEIEVSDDHKRCLREIMIVSYGSQSRHPISRSSRSCSLTSQSRDFENRC